MRRGFVVKLWRTGDDIHVDVVQAQPVLPSGVPHAVAGFEDEKLRALGHDVRAAMRAGATLTDDTKDRLDILSERFRGGVVAEAFRKFDSDDPATVLFEPISGETDCDVTQFPWQALRVDDLYIARSKNLIPGRLVRQSISIPLPSQPLECIRVLPVVGFEGAVVDIGVIRETCPRQVQLLKTVVARDLDTLYEALRASKPDALHLRIHAAVGHREAALIFDEACSPVPVADLAEGIREHAPGLRFVFLDSCLGANERRLASAARRLCLTGGVGAVITYWEEVLAPTATKVARLFYERLISDGARVVDLVAGLATARRKAFAKCLDARTLAPVIFVSTPKAQQIRMTVGPPETPPPPQMLSLRPTSPVPDPAPSDWFSHYRDFNHVITALERGCRVVIISGGNQVSRRALADDVLSGLAAERWAAVELYRPSAAPDIVDEALRAVRKAAGVVLRFAAASERIGALLTDLEQLPAGVCLIITTTEWTSLPQTADGWVHQQHLEPLPEPRTPAASPDELAQSLASGSSEPKELEVARAGGVAPTYIRVSVESRSDELTLAKFGARVGVANRPQTAALVSREELRAVAGQPGMQVTWHWAAPAGVAESSELLDPVRMCQRSICVLTPTLAWTVTATQPDDGVDPEFETLERFLDVILLLGGRR